MADIKTWERGESVRINNTYTDSDDAVFDPDTVELKIYDPTGTLILTVTYAAAEITKVSTGVYYYDYTVASDALTGWWNSKWAGVTSGFSDVTRMQFMVSDPEQRLYCTPDEVWLRAGQDETFVTRNNVVAYIKDSMADIDIIYQKNFNYTNTVTEWFDTDSPDEDMTIDAIFLLYTPIRSITSVKTYDTAGNEVDSLTGTDYLIDLKTGRLKLRDTEFGHQTARIEVVYTYGYDNVPGEIHNLCVILSAMRVLLNFIGESVDQVTSYNACGICLINTVKLLTVDGYQEIGSLSGKNVQLINKDGNISDGKVWCTGEREVIELVLSNGNTIGCTPDHLFMVSDGYGVKAINLIDKRLMLYNSQKDIRVIKINMMGTDTVYDFTEPLTNWGVIYNDIIIHNSISVGEPYTASAKSLEILLKERDKIIGNIGRLRPSIFIG